VLRVPLHATKNYGYIYDNLIQHIRFPGNDWKRVPNSYGAREQPCCPLTNANSCSCTILLGNLANQQFHFTTILGQNGGRSSGIYTTPHIPEDNSLQSKRREKIKPYTRMKSLRLLT